MLAVASTSRALLGVTLAALGLVSGCAAGQVDPDAGAGDAAVAPDALELRFSTVNALQLTPLQNASVEVRATLNGEPLSGVALRLGLEGEAHDASLSALRGATDAEGWVRTTLRASSIPATFRVRATTSATDAAPAFLPVGVSATGFGNVLAHVEDLSGTTPTRVRVEAYPNADCAHPSVAEGRFGRALTLLTGEASARFLGLPAGAGYAFVARGETAGGDELAFGCEDEVLVTSDAEAELTIRLGARVQVLSGTYDATFSFPAADFAPVHEAARVDVTTSMLADGDAGFLLDALAAHLLAEGEFVALATFEAARLGGLDEDFAQHLASEGAGPSVALASAAAFLTGQTALALAGEMVIEAPGTTTFTTTSLALLGVSGVYSALPLAGGGEPTLDFVTEIDTVGAVLVFDPVVVGFAFGTNVESILTEAQTQMALGSWRTLAGAGSAAGFAIAAVDAVCDEACRSDVYAEASRGVRDAWLDALGRAAASLTLSFVGGAAASDPDGDFRADALSAVLTGSGVVGGLPLALGGVLEATRSETEATP